MYKKWNVKFNLLCTFGSFSSFSWRWARNPLYFVSFGFLVHLFEPISWFSPKVLWLSVTNPVILSWHSYCCWAVLSIQSLPVSCMENSTQGKKKTKTKNTPGLILANICDKMKISTQLYWNLLRYLIIAAYWRLLKKETPGTCNKTQEDGLCILCSPRSRVLKVSDTQCALDRVEIPILI